MTKNLKAFLAAPSAWAATYIHLDQSGRQCLAMDSLPLPSSKRCALTIGAENGEGCF